jgi:hypothetical protein
MRCLKPYLSFHLPLLLVAGLVAYSAGCASKNVDPAVARSHTGYVDFYAANDDDLCWEIIELKHNREIVREFKPVPDHILRFAFRPGEYEFHVSFLNRVVTKTATVKVTVRDGMVTPVKVTLIETGTAMVQTKEARVGGTWYGRVGRSTKFRENEAGIFQLNAESQDPVPYEPKAGMTYAKLPAK